MEIRARYFFLFWGLISFTFLELGLDAIHKTELSNSVSPTLMSFLKFSLIVSSNWSFTYAFAFHRHMKTSINIHLAFHAFMRCVFSTTYVAILYLYFLVPVINDLSALFFFYFESHLTTGAVTMIKLIVLALYTLIVFLLDKLMFAGIVALTILNLAYPHWREDLMDIYLQYTRPTTDLPATQGNFSTNRKGMNMMKRWVEFAVGMVGTSLFQSFFSLTSFHQVVVVFYFAVVWLANIVLVSASHVYGVFNFRLGNVVVGCTVSELRASRYYLDGLWSCSTSLRAESQVRVCGIGE